MAIHLNAARSAFHRDGFAILPDMLQNKTVQALRQRFERLFAGDFETGMYPDEWHWREGISRPDAVREIVNGWKSSPVVARVALSPSLGRAASDLLGWSSGYFSLRYLYMGSLPTAMRSL